MSPGRRNGKLYVQVGRDEQLASYQESVREVMTNWFVDHPEWDEFFPMTCEVVITFYFWRTLSEYTTSSDQKHSRHYADATNMAKATEDALQGILYENDRQVRDMRGVIMEQATDTKGCIVIEIEPFIEPPDLRKYASAIREAQSATPQSDNNWTGPEGMF